MGAMRCRRCVAMSGASQRPVVPGSGGVTVALEAQPVGATAQSGSEATPGPIIDEEQHHVESARFMSPSLMPMLAHQVDGHPRVDAAASMVEPRRG